MVAQPNTYLEMSNGIVMCHCQARVIYCFCKPDHTPLIIFRSCLLPVLTKMAFIVLVYELNANLFTAKKHWSSCQAIVVACRKGCKDDWVENWNL